MAKTEPFDRYTDIYEQWFADHYYVFQSELLALKQLVPENGKGVEIGVGTGRFAEPMGIKEGVDPSKAMINVAAERGIHVRVTTNTCVPKHFGAQAQRNNYNNRRVNPSVNKQKYKPMKILQSCS